MTTPTPATSSSRPAPTRRHLLARVCAAGLAVAACTPAQAVDAPPPAASAAAMTDAEIRKIDVASGKITLRHAEIKALDMPAMTMVFQARDRKLLEGLKAGDKVRFRAVQEGSQLIVTAIEGAR